MSTTRVALTLLAVFATGCSLVYDPSQFMGADAGDRDAGTMQDSGPDEDAGPRDAGYDANTDAGPTVRVRVVNAVGYATNGTALGMITVNIAGDERTIPFGCIEAYDIPLGDPSIILTADAPPVTTSVRLTENTLLVIARDDTPAGLVTAFPQPDVPPTATSGRSALTYLNVFRQTEVDGSALYMVTDVRAGSVMPIAVPFGTWSAPREYASTFPATVVVGFATGAFNLTPRILTSFTTELLTESSFMILTGTGNAHPSAPAGPRGILVPATGTACGTQFLADPQIVLANLPIEGRNILNGQPIISGCAVDTMFGATNVQAEHLSILVPVFQGLTRFGLAADGAANDACNTSLLSTRVIDLDSMGVSPGQRYLLAVTGAVSGPSGGWTVTLLEEAIPNTVAEMGVTYAHVATTVPVAVDIRGQGTLYSPNLALGGTDPTVVDSLAFPSGPWAVNQAGMATVIGNYSTTLDYDTPAGGAFFILFDQNDVGVAEPRVAFVKSSYAGLWDVQIRQR